MLNEEISHVAIGSFSLCETGESFGCCFFVFYILQGLNLMYSKLTLGTQRKHITEELNQLGEVS